MSERRDEQTVIEVDPKLKITLHQSEMYGSRYAFYILVDKIHNLRLDVKQARRLNEALTQLLAKVEDA